MKKLNEILAMILFSLAAVLGAAIGFRVYDTYVNDRQEKEEQREQEQVLLRNREANERVLEMRREIQELSEDRERLLQFLEELQTVQAEAVIPVSMMFEQESGMTGSLPETEMTYMSEEVADTSLQMANMSENIASKAEITDIGRVDTTNVSWNMTSVSENMMNVSEMDMVSGNTLSISENDTVSGNVLSISENDMLSENTLAISGNNIVSENALEVSGNDTPSANEIVSGNMMDLLPKIEMVYPEITLAERRQIRSSSEETLMADREDQLCLEERYLDFSEAKIACLGDSITAATNLEGQENYPACSYPAVLQKLLGAKEVVNLGIGGSAIGRYWSDSFVERYREIPQDTDIIIVMGGTNDGFCLSEKEFGTLAERKPWTFCGDLDELMRGLKEAYPHAAVYFVTPLPNILQDYLMKERSYLLPQSDLVNVILTLSEEYGFHTIDLYNSNLLDSHDADIVADYIPDGVHANETGYRILAQHIAAEILHNEERQTAPLQ